MRKRSRSRKTAGIILSVVLLMVLVLAGGVTFMVRGLNQVENLVINNVNLENLPDGVYRGSFEGFRWSNTVEVTVQGNTITEINVVETHPFHRQELVNELAVRIIKSQVIAADTVTDATVSSKAFLKAVENALVREQ